MPLSFLDDKGPGTQHPGTGEPGSTAPAGEKKKEDHRQQILVIGSIVGVVIAWFTYKSVKGGGASASGTQVSSASVPNSTSGTVAGSGMDTDAYNAFTSYLQNINGEVQGLQNSINTQANSTSTLPATTGSSSGTYAGPELVGDLQAFARTNDPTVASDWATYQTNIGSYANQQAYLGAVNDYSQTNNIAQATPGQTITAGLGQGTVAGAPSTT